MGSFLQKNRFVEDTPKKCFNNFLQSAVIAQRQGDESPKSSLIAEAVKLVANSSFSFQILDPRRHTVTKCLNDEGTLSAITGNFFKSSVSCSHQNNRLIVFNVEWRRNGRNCHDCDKNVSQQVHQEFFSLGPVARNTENIILWSIVFPKKNSCVRKRCIFVVKPNTATVPPISIWNSAAKVSVNGYQRGVVMVLWKKAQGF